MSSLRDTQKPSGPGPGQLAVSGCASAGDLDQTASRGPIQSQLYCERRFVDSFKDEDCETALLYTFRLSRLYLDVEM